MPRPPGHQNVVPGRREITERVADLRQRADAGDAMAAAALVLIGLAVRPKVRQSENPAEWRTKPFF